MDEIGHIDTVVWASLLMQVMGLLTVLTVLLLAARAVRHAAPRWIPCVIVAAAVADFLTELPFLLMHPLVQGWIGGISVQQYSRIAVANGLIDWTAGIALAIGVLAMARNLKRMKEQGAGNASSGGAPGARIPSR